MPWGLPYSDRKLIVAPCTGSWGRQDTCPYYSHWLVQRVVSGDAEPVRPSPGALRQAGQVLCPGWELVHGCGRGPGGVLLPPKWGSANPGWTRPCRKEEGQGKRRATPDICGARAKLQDTKTRAPPLQAGDGGIYAHRPRSLSFWDVPEGWWSRLGLGSFPVSGLGRMTDPKILGLAIREGDGNSKGGPGGRGISQF